MMNLQTETSILKNRLIKNLGSLNKSDVQNMLDFSEFLLFKGDKKKRVRSAVLDPRKDPILEIIGIADVEPFADRIDQQLYGV